MTSRILELGPDDALFADWCAVWAAAQAAERPDEPSRPVTDHVAIGRELTTPARG